MKRSKDYLSKKRQQNEIYKIPLEKVAEAKDYELKDYTDEKAQLQGETVKIMDNLVFKKIRDYYKEHENDKELSADKLAKDIVNIVMPMNSTAKDMYINLAVMGFKINDGEMKRLMSGSGQIRRNTVTFIKKKLYDYILNSLLCGLTLEDFGDDFNAAKFNAYFGLYMSGCLLLKDFPKVCIIDDYEEIIPDMEVNYIRTEDVRYLVLPDGDYTLEEKKDDFIFYDACDNVTTDLNEAISAIRKSEEDSADATVWKVFTGTRKYPTVIKYSEIGKEENSKDKPAPPLNSFDGQGLANPEWVQKVADELGFDYLPSEMIIRAPWVKGLVATFPISSYLKSRGIKQVNSLCGDIMNVDDVDIFISKSQFKMYKIYSKKVEELNAMNPDETMTAWEYHKKAMKDNGLLWGIVMPNKKSDDRKKESNYQYDQALSLSADEDIDKLTLETEKYLKGLCTHDIRQVFDSLMAHKKVAKEETCTDKELDEEIEDTAENNEYQSLLQKVVTHNSDFLGDKYIQSLINKECEKGFKNAMIGKLIFDGNFQFIVSDPLAQAQWIYKNHTKEEYKNNPDIKVEGIVKANHIYSEYWKGIAKKQDKKEEQIVLMRSPLIDKHEVTKMDLIMDNIEEFQYLKSGIILSIHDLATLQMQNCDFDGDRCFSSNMDILKKGCLNKTYPLYFEPGEGSIVGCIDDANIIVADVRGLNSKVGQFSNKSTSFYAMLPLYNEDSREYKSLTDAITVLGEIVGTEIDKIKTGIAPVQPYNWKPIQVTYKQKQKDNGEIENVSLYSEEQKKAIYHHNELVPDKKPYFFRYNYPYLDKDIKRLENEINKECKYNYGLKLSEILDKYDNQPFCDEVNTILEKMKDEKKKKPEYQLPEDKALKVKIFYTIRKFKWAYPVLDTDCIMNKICHKFEELEKEYSGFNDGMNMLHDYIIQDIEFDKDKLMQIKKYIQIYKRHRKFVIKNNNVPSGSSSNVVAKDTKQRLDSLLEYTRKNIYGIFEEGTDRQLILTYLLKVMKSEKDEQHVWEIMGDDLLSIIPQKKYQEKKENTD